MSNRKLEMKLKSVQNMAKRKANKGGAQTGWQDSEGRQFSLMQQQIINQHQPIL